ncbi:PREDICTED: HAUS augmin-like complex subunit 6 [Mandrillus leucophaeus]|uniref:HAUS augmin-like complex subunit 6 n=1 Tax=Mandrillus leucophaeus TaxID=9568 RepID=UPI0005F4402B|nr:PREDICTED: HAUS augmin-like complex subunit 6 [Mandrillus leucophaeus]
MSSASITAFEKEHLWMYLQALGFEPGPATIACGKIVSHTHLGVNMFDKLNRDAFHIVSYFLFQVLDQSLTKEVFNHKARAPTGECGSSFPQVVGSLFLSPGGPKFIHLMYHFARFVAMKYIKSNSKNSSHHFVETFNIKPQDLHKCIARCHFARSRFLQILQREDCVTQKYQENAQLSVKQVRNLRSECIGLENQIKKMEPYDDHSNIEEKIQKVRSLWASVNETLMFLEKEREVVSSVLSLVNQYYALDGTDVAINIPRLLLDKIEKQMFQLHIGNVYEAGKLNLLTVIQLLNEVLKVMKYERCQADEARLTVDLHYLEKETKFQKERLSDLKHMSLIKGWTPSVDLLPPMSPLSFDPASEEVYAKSILCQYPASLPDTHKQHNQENGCRGDSNTLGALHDLANSPASFLLQSVSSSDRNSVTLLEKDTKMRTPKEKNEAISKKIPEFEVENSPLSDVAMNTESSTFGESLPAKKSDPFQKEQDHLVEEIARAVLSDSPQLSEGNETKLEELMDSLGSNPFLTRNQIPRTPENLITEIRSSWRKAIEMEENRTAEPTQMDAEHREVLPESLPVLHSQREFSMDDFLLETTVSDFGQSRSTEEKVVSDCKCVPQKPVLTSHIDEPPTQSQSDLLNKKVICKQDLECLAFTKLSETSQMETFSPAVGNRIDVMGGSEEEFMKILDHLEVSCNKPSTNKTMLWNSFQISSEISSKSFKDNDFGILHETLPEEVGHLSFNSSSSSEANFKLEPNSPMHGGILLENVVGGRQTTPESDFNIQALRSRYEALKKSLSKKREESYLSNSQTPERHKPELSPTPQNVQTDDVLNFLDTRDLHTDRTKTSLPMSIGERKRSLSPLIKFSPVEQRLRTTISCSLGELPNLKEEDILNKSLDAKEPPSDLTR